MYPVIGKDEKFLALLIKLAHITDLKVHRNILGTQAQFMRGFYGVFHLNFKHKVTDVLHACIHCRKIAARTYVCPFKRYAKLTTDRIFSKVSIDFLGPLLIKGHSSDRKRNKYYILVVACISTGAITMYILDNYDTLSAILALMKLQCSYGKITHITADAGTNLLESNINLPLKEEEGIM